MAHTNFDGLTATQIKEQLQEHAAKIEERDYFKPFTEDELLSEKEVFTEKSIELADTEAEFKEVKTEWGNKIKLQKSDVNITMKNIRQKGQTRYGKVYLCDDQQEGYMYAYSEDGEQLERRRLRPDEKQASMKMKRA